MIAPVYFELPDGRRAAVTDHLLERWCEFACPGADRLGALRRLDQWLDLTAAVTEEPPPWCLADVERPGLVEVAWIVAGDYVIPVLDDRGRLYAPTLIARGCLTVIERHARNHQARAERANRRRRRTHKAAQEARSGDRRRRRGRLAPTLDDQDTV